MVRSKMDEGIQKIIKEALFMKLDRKMVLIGFGIGFAVSLAFWWGLAYLIMNIWR